MNYIYVLVPGSDFLVLVNSAARRLLMAAGFRARLNSSAAFSQLQMRSLSMTIFGSGGIGVDKSDIGSSVVNNFSYYNYCKRTDA